MAPPVSESELKRIAHDACNTALLDSPTYKHESTATWNGTIVSKTLSSLIAASSVGDAPPSFKFMVNSTIIQHSTSDSAPGGRRGMHSAAGAYWDNEKDGMWSYKFDGGEKRGMDVVVCIMWVAL